MSEPVPTEFNEQAAVEVPITPDPAAERRKRHRQKMAERAANIRAFEQIGMRVMKIRVKTLSAVGVDIEKAGIKNFGHGVIAHSGEQAQNMIDELGDIVQELRSRTPPVDPMVIIEAIALQRQLNEQVLESGKSHINATKQVEPENKGNQMSVAFPAGTPMMIGVPPQKASEIDGGKA